MGTGGKQCTLLVCVAHSIPRGYIFLLSYYLNVNKLISFQSFAVVYYRSIVHTHCTTTEEVKNKQMSCPRVECGCLLLWSSLAASAPEQQPMIPPPQYTVHSTSTVATCSTSSSAYSSSLVLLPSTTTYCTTVLLVPPPAVVVVMVRTAAQQE